MGQTTKGIVYPSDYSEIADLPSDLQTMAESIDTAIDGVTIPIDSALSPTSTNPVQNKVIYETLEDYQAKIDSSNKLSADLVDDTSTTNKFVSANEKAQITTNANDIATINGILPNKQNTLTFDATPTESSTNPVTSGGIKTYVDTIVGDIESILEELDVRRWCKCQ